MLRFSIIILAHFILSLMIQTSSFASKEKEQDYSSPAPRPTVSKENEQVKELPSPRLNSSIEPFIFAWDKDPIQEDDILASYDRAQKQEERPEEDYDPYRQICASENSPEQWKGKKIRILSVDGGGIRGIIPANLLNKIEQGLSDEFQYSVKVSEFFDFVAGTSTGSIITLGLVVPNDLNKFEPKYTAQILMNIYEGEEARQIFPQDWWREKRSYIFGPKHSAEVLEGILKTRFQYKKLSQALRGIHTLVPAYNITQHEEWLFEGEGDRTKPEIDHEMRLVARASSAAPTYFEAANIMGEYYVDGGMFMNDPSLAAYAKAKKDFHPQGQFMVVSLGTGTSDERLPQGLEIASKIGWASSCVPVMMKGASQSTQRVMNLLSATDTSLEHYRVQVKVKKEIMDDTSPKSVAFLKSAALKLWKEAFEKGEAQKDDRFSKKKKTIDETQAKSIASLQKTYTELHEICRKKTEVLKTKLNIVFDKNIGINFTVTNITTLNLSELPLRTKLSLREKVGGCWEGFLEILKSNTLAMLNLRRTGLCQKEGSGYDDIKEICDALRRNTALTSLNLAENGIGTEGVSYLGELLKSNVALRELGLRNTGITAKASEELKTLLENEEEHISTSLTCLDLSTNTIGGIGLKSLLNTLETLNNTSLRVLDLSFNNIGKSFASQDNRTATTKFTAGMKSSKRKEEINAKISELENTHKFRIVVDNNDL